MHEGYFIKMVLQDIFYDGPTRLFTAVVTKGKMPILVVLICPQDAVHGVPDQQGAIVVRTQDQDFERVS